jgi:hypothetical protein
MAQSFVELLQGNGGAAEITVRRFLLRRKSVRAKRFFDGEGKFLLLPTVV